jgi:hypothetical protein
LLANSTLGFSSRIARPSFSLFELFIFEVF